MFRKGKNTERITFYSVSRACKESIHLNALTFGNGEKYLQRGQNLQHLTGVLEFDSETNWAVSDPFHSPCP